MFENEFNPIPLGGELVVPVEGTLEAEIVEETVNETVVDSTLSEEEVIADTFVNDDTTADNKTKKFVINNWLKEPNNSETLHRLDKKGGALYMQNGIFWYRQSVYTEFEKMPLCIVR